MKMLIDLNKMRYCIFVWLQIVGLPFLVNNQQSYPKVVIQTDLGAVTAEIYVEQAPVTAGNFLSLVEAGVYDTGASFYRVVRDDNQPNSDVKIEVIQGGLRDSRDKSLTPIRHETTQETGLKHVDGALSMARSAPGTANSEFFICIGDQPELDFGGRRNPDGVGFAVFGRIIDGMDVVLKIQQQEDRNQSLIDPVQIFSIRRR